MTVQFNAVIDEKIAGSRPPGCYEKLAASAGVHLRDATVQLLLSYLLYCNHEVATWGRLPGRESA